MAAATRRIMISIEGGVVQGVSANFNDPDLEFIVCDYDEHNNVVKLPDGRLESACAFTIPLVHDPNWLNVDPVVWTSDDVEQAYREEWEIWNSCIMPLMTSPFTIEATENIVRQKAARGSVLHQRAIRIVDHV